MKNTGIYCLRITKGKQSIKTDKSISPSVCMATKKLYESKGFTCQFYINTRLKRIHLEDHF